MLSLSNLDVVETLRLFKAANIPVSFLVPTETGMKKSIMDATKEVRHLLLRSGIHDFEKQQQGIDNKSLINTKLVSNNSLIETKTSFYRPATKSGDPRIWIYDLKKFADPHDLLALISDGKNLVVVNCSKNNLQQLLDSNNSIFTSILSSAVVGRSEVADELLSMLRDIAKRGFIKTLKSGDTGIGYTLETKLGIEANSSQNPDYKGIEIKSLRKRSGKGSLFSMVPNWGNSNIKSATELVLKRGKINHKKGDLITIFHTMNCVKPNSYDMQLLVDEEMVWQVYVKDSAIEKDVVWSIAEFKNRLSAKHKETFWIDVETRGEGRTENEEFKFTKVVHTSNPDLESIPILMENGILTMDYLIWEKRDDWKKYVNKKGYDFLWKIKKSDRHLLFKSENRYSLSSP